MQPLSGHQRPDLLTCLTHVSLVLRLPRGMHLCRSSSNVPRLPTFLKLLQNLHLFCSLLAGCRIPCACPHETTLQRPKAARTCGAFSMFISQCASRHNRVHFFNISTSKSGLDLRCFVHFDLEMCFAPQRRSLFEHLDFQKWSDAEVLLHF